MVPMLTQLSPLPGSVWRGSSITCSFGELLESITNVGRAIQKRQQQPSLPMPQRGCYRDAFIFPILEKENKIFRWTTVSVQ